MIENKIEILTEKGKDLYKLANLLLSTLPKLGFKFNPRESGLIRSEYNKIDWAAYAFTGRNKESIKYEYDSKKDGIYNASLELKLAEGTYSEVLTLLEEGFPHLINQKVA